jgi:hypothetical protein
LCSFCRFGFFKNFTRTKLWYAFYTHCWQLFAFFTSELCGRMRICKPRVPRNRVCDYGAWLLVRDILVGSSCKYVISRSALLFPQK